MVLLYCLKGMFLLKMLLLMVNISRALFSNEPVQLVGRFVGRSVGWLVGWLVSRLVSRSVSQSVGRSGGR